MKTAIALVVIFLCIPWAARADEPLPPPARTTTCSPSGNFCAVSDPVQNITLLSRSGSDRILWSIPGWHRWLFLSDDGESFVVGYSGMNLVPMDVTLAEPVLFFYNRGRLVRTVKLGELYPDRSQLLRTASHYAWADIRGFNKVNQLVVDLADGKRVAFSAKAGQVQRLATDGT
ncbi:hypothetical protein H1235_15710 [Pseudoxanthomonas sp. NC8]|nr:hypothetical protein H1235_15710 [Pseudoxanthomonas sp. NC8]